MKTTYITLSIIGFIVWSVFIYDVVYTKGVADGMASSTLNHIFVQTMDDCGSAAQWKFDAAHSSDTFHTWTLQCEDKWISAGSLIN